MTPLTDPPTPSTITPTQPTASTPPCGLNPSPIGRAKSDTPQLVPPDDPPLIDLDLRQELRDQIAADLGPLEQLLAPWSREDQLVVSKRLLAEVHACEVHSLLESDFEWNSMTVRGRIAHHAIRHALGDGGRGDLREVARSCVTFAAEEDRDQEVRALLEGMSPVATDELIWSVAAILEDFFEAVGDISIPQPVTPEYRVSARLAPQVFATGKVDLAVGQPKRGRRGRVLIEFKTGAPSDIEQRADAMFYALLETLKTGPAPLRTSTWYLDQGEIHIQEVTNGALVSAAARLTDGIRKIAELRQDHRDPVARGGWRCNFCPLSAGCEEAAARLKQRGEHAR